MTLGSGAGRCTEPGRVGAGGRLDVAAGPFPTATGGGMSSSSMALPFRTEASRFSSVWKKVSTWVLEEHGAECRGSGGPRTLLSAHSP